MTAHDPLTGPLLGRSCPSCGLASRLVAADDGAPAALCLKCRGAFLPDDALTVVLGAWRKTLPPTLPAFVRSLLCPRCEHELHGVLVSGVAAYACPEGHGAFFDAERFALFRRLVDAGAPDVVAAGFLTGPGLGRPGYVRVFTDRAPTTHRARGGHAASWTALAVVGAIVLLAWKLGA